MERFEEILKEIAALANQKGPGKIEKLNALNREAKKILQEKSDALYAAYENSLNCQKNMG